MKSFPSESFTNEVRAESRHYLSQGGAGGAIKILLPAVTSDNVNTKLVLVFI